MTSISKNAHIDVKDNTYINKVKKLMIMILNLNLVIM